jgi:hypothetical protein
LCSLPLITSGQYSRHPSLTEKYLHYRERLKSQFLLCYGTGPGCSLPASIRNTYDEHYRGRATIKWGDGTIDLAVYISVLATEFKLLQNENQNTEATLTELYYALETFNRLDYYGDTCFGMPPSLNGFFIRSDAGAGLFNNPLKKQEALNRLNASGMEVHSLSSEFLNYLNGDTKLFAVSKDQVFLLLMAMKLVTLYLPEEVISTAGTFMDGERSFSKEAKNIAIRLLDWIHPPEKSNFFTHWKIRSPSGGKVKAGNNAWTYAALLSEIVKDISGTRNPERKGFSWMMAKGIREFSWLAYKPVFFFNRSESFKTLLLEALCGKRKNKADRFYKRAYSFTPYRWYLIPLLYGCLHNAWPENFNSAFYESLLQAAPEEGPFHLYPGDFAHPQWSSTSLIIHPRRTTHDSPHFPGRYNGLDYMLLYNLFLIAGQMKE